MIDSHPGFTLHDFLTKVIPGAILAGPAITALLLYYPNIFSSTTASVFLVVFILFLSGEMVDQFRIAVFPAPGPFSYFLTESLTDCKEDTAPSSYTKRIFSIFKSILRKIISYLPYVQVIGDGSGVTERLDMDFRTHIESQFQIDFEKVEDHDIYDLLVMHLEPTMSRRTRRQRSLYILITNLKMSYVIAFFMYVVLLLFNPGNEIIQLSTLLLITVAAFTFLLLSFMRVTGSIYVELLLKEFYLSEIAEQEKIPGGEEALTFEEQSP